MILCELWKTGKDRSLARGSHARLILTSAWSMCSADRRFLARKSANASLARSQH
jgi:hypothetical protein